MTATDLEAPLTTPDTRLVPHQPEKVSYIDRLRLGGDEPAICAAIDLGPHSVNDNGQEADVRMVLMDVGFRRREDGKFGPYDLAGNGEKRLFSSDYVLIAEDRSGDEPEMRYFEVPVGEDVELGRRGPVAEALGYKQNTYVSKNHALLRVFEAGGVEIVDEGSTNGTDRRDLSELGASSGGEDEGFGYTVGIGDYISRAGKGAHYVSPREQEGWGHGIYSGRPIIARDTPINGGVYPVGGKHGEAIVIDDEKYPEQFNQVYDRLIDSLSPRSHGLALSGLRNRLKFRRGEKAGQGDELRVLQTVFNEVSNVLKYDLEATKAIGGDAKKISLNKYIAEGVGVCRTQAALSAYLIERLVKDGFLQGYASIDRNSARMVDGVKGHAWARYKDGQGQVFIIDPAQKFVGRLEEANQRAGWDYRRTEDLVQELLSSRQ